MNVYENLSLENLPGEVWKDIKGYEGRYQVSNKGRVKALYKERVQPLNGGIRVYPEYIMKQDIRKGYLRVGLTLNGKQKGFFVHRLVGEAFIVNTDNKPEINHIDEDTKNNTVENLEWCTRAENINHGTRNERVSNTNKGKRMGGALNLKKIKCITTGKIFNSVKEAKEFYGIKGHGNLLNPRNAGSLNGVKLKWEFIEDDE